MQSKAKTDTLSMVHNPKHCHKPSPPEVPTHVTPCVPLPTRQHLIGDGRGCGRGLSADPHWLYQGHAVRVVCNSSLSGQKQHDFILQSCSSCFHLQIEFTMTYKQQQAQPVLGGACRTVYENFIQSRFHLRCIYNQEYPAANPINDPQSVE